MKKILKINLPCKTRVKLGNEKTFEIAVKKLKKQYDYLLSLPYNVRKTVVIKLYMKNES